MKVYKLITLVIILILIGCAKKGNPTGGKKDEIAPVLVKAYPDNESTNFNGDKIKINFDEYIVLRNLNKQLIISPPLKKIPVIFPQGSVSDYIKIEFKEELKKNTTYTFNFGNAIQDNNEGNKLEGFKYVFSTGNEIDSLEYKGQVIDALGGKLKSNCAVLLYNNETFNDSIPLKEKPFYVTTTRDSLNFKFTNIKEGTYRLFAIKENAQDFIFNPKEDKFAYYQKTISLPKDSVLSEPLRLFKEDAEFKFKRASQISKGKILFKYKGKPSEFKVELLSKVPAKFNTYSQFEKDKDTLNFWYSDIKIDTLKFLIKNNKKVIDTAFVKLGKRNIDSLSVDANINGKLNLNDTLFFNLSNPLIRLNKSKISLTNKKDSTKVSFKIFEKNKREVGLIFNKKEKTMYELQALPSAFTDIFNVKNDTINRIFFVKSKEDYGSIIITLENNTKSRLIFNVLMNGKVVRKKIVKSDAKKVIFNHLNPSTYKIQVIIDKNSNNIWDTGKYLEKIQPERTIYLEKELRLKANWSIEENFVID